jgi:hypothetical protein
LSLAKRSLRFGYQGPRKRKGSVAVILKPIFDSLEANWTLFTL